MEYYISGVRNLTVPLRECNVTSPYITRYMEYYISGVGIVSVSDGV